MTISRQTQNSATIGSEDYHSTSVTVSARQRFFQRIYLGLTGGYQNLSYFSTQNDISSSRTDNYYFIQVSLDLQIRHFWVAGAYYSYREDDSSLDAFSFYDNQIGFRTSLTF